jgi:hypothetical protein
MKRLAFFADGTHNDTWQCHGYYEVINRFLAEVSTHFSSSDICNWETFVQHTAIPSYLYVCQLNHAER